MVFILSVHSQHIYECYFDYDEKCLPGRLSASTILLNETSEEPRQPTSDVTAICKINYLYFSLELLFLVTSNNQGECFFPFQVNSFDMFFCQQTDPNLPATCPIFNATGPRINCSEGEYGYEKFEIGQIGSRSYKIDERFSFSSEKHCIRFYYYLSDENSNGSIKVILEDNQLNQNTTIVTVSTRSQNRWYQIRKSFLSPTEDSTVIFILLFINSLEK